MIKPLQRDEALFTVMMNMKRKRRWRTNGFCTGRIDCSCCHLQRVQQCESSSVFRGQLQSMHVFCTLIKIFIHSFILNIYIAPLQENYSEALPTPARLKRAVLRKNAGDKALWKIRSWEGSPFQIEGPTMEKARLCLAEVRANGTRRRPCWG